MKSMKYVNMFNRGIQRVKDALAENGNPEPQFNVNLITVFEVVTKPSIDFSVSDGGNKKEPNQNERNTLKKLSKRQATIYELIKENPMITVVQMSYKMDVTDRTIYRDLENMKDKGVEITREGGKTFGEWIIRVKDVTS